MKFLSSLFGSRSSETVAPIRAVAPLEITSTVPGSPFRITDHLWTHEGLPLLDWGPAEDWLSRAPSEEARAAATIDCQRAWLLHLRDALGEPYELHESVQCFVLTAHAGESAAAVLSFVARTRKRILATLEGLAQEGGVAREILIVFSDPETYYQYVAHAYPSEGEFSFSSGMFLHAGCAHFVAIHDDMHTVERVIAHEMTHASLAHLPIPLWLNEGIAVNTEDRLMGQLPKMFTPAEMRAQHLAFWNEQRIQEFWSGKSFHRPDEGNRLSYDLAQILIRILSSDWSRFRAFVLAAHYDDSGSAAAREYLDLELGEAAASIFEQASSEGWHPRPEKWQERLRARVTKSGNSWRLRQGHRWSGVSSTRCFME